MASSSVATRGRNCVVVVKQALREINAGNLSIATTKLSSLTVDSVFLAKEAENLAKRLEYAEKYYIAEAEQTARMIGRAGCEEEALRKKMANEESKLASQRAILEDNQSKLSSAEDDLQSAERKLESEKENNFDVIVAGAITGAIVGLPFFGIGALFTAAAGAGGAGIVVALGDDVKRAKQNVESHKQDLSRARHNVSESERCVCRTKNEIHSLENKVNALKKKQCGFHQKAGEIKQGIAILKSSVQFWKLFKQASEHGTIRTTLLQQIVKKANEMADYTIIFERSGSKRVAKSFLDAWEDIELKSFEGSSSHMLQITFSCSFCKQGCTALPHVSKNGNLACNSCSYRCAVQN